jgi:hypothetical protein
MYENVTIKPIKKRNQKKGFLWSCSTERSLKEASEALVKSAAVFLVKNLIKFYNCNVCTSQYIILHSCFFALTLAGLFSAIILYM